MRSGLVAASEVGVGVGPCWCWCWCVMRVGCCAEFDFEQPLTSVVNVSIYSILAYHLQNLSVKLFIAPGVDEKTELLFQRVFQCYPCATYRLTDVLSFNSLSSVLS